MFIRGASLLSGKVNLIYYQSFSLSYLELYLTRKIIFPPATSESAPATYNPRPARKIFKKNPTSLFIYSFIYLFNDRYSNQLKKRIISRLDKKEKNKQTNKTEQWIGNC